MVFRFILISDEVENFMREIQIDSDATFLDLHKAILKSCDYPDDQITSFFICENGWEKTQEITLEDMGTSYEDDTYLMANTRLSELLEDEKQHMLYRYDILGDRMFFIELSEIITRKTLDEAVVTRSIGNPPPQRLNMDELDKRNPVIYSADYVDEDMTSDDFSDEDIAMEGLDLSDEF